jgi:hypothetical protein
MSAGSLHVLGSSAPRTPVFVLDFGKVQVALDVQSATCWRPWLGLRAADALIQAGVSRGPNRAMRLTLDTFGADTHTGTVIITVSGSRMRIRVEFGCVRAGGSGRRECAVARQQFWGGASCKRPDMILMGFGCLERAGQLHELRTPSTRCFCALPLHNKAPCQQRAVHAIGGGFTYVDGRGSKKAVPRAQTVPGALTRRTVGHWRCVTRHGPSFSLAAECTLISTFACVQHNGSSTLLACLNTVILPPSDHSRSPQIHAAL